MGRHMLIYHVAIPVAVFLVLLVAGMPLGSAFGIGMMAGCASMVLMMAGGGHHGPPRPEDHHADEDTVRRPRIIDHAHLPSGRPG